LLYLFTGDQAEGAQHSTALPAAILKGRFEMTQGQNLLTGSTPKSLAAFALPLFPANLLQAFYNVVDMLVVGKIVGKTGLAAISNASMLCFIMNALPIGLGKKYQAGGHPIKEENKL